MAKRPTIPPPRKPRTLALWLFGLALALSLCFTGWLVARLTGAH